MVVQIENQGKALIHFSQARNLLRNRYNELANCRTCQQQVKDSLLEGIAFYEQLIDQINKV
jgi:hypothetical protein